jgi:hypothetical protein
MSIKPIAIFMCGERGIRTPGTLITHTRFPSVLLKPLGHLSKERETDFFQKPVSTLHYFASFYQASKISTLV